MADAYANEDASFVSKKDIPDTDNALSLVLEEDLADAHDMVWGTAYPTE